MTVMLVVPTSIERAGLRAFLEEAGGTRVVAEASEGSEALRLAQDTEPDVAIIDSWLPDTTALGLVHFMRLKLLRTQALIYMDSCQRDFIVNAVREGVRAFVLKSKANKHLRRALEALAAGRPYWEGAVDGTILDELLESGPRPSPSKLSSREWQVLQLVAQGRSDKQVAYALGLSTKTVVSHRSKLRRKLGFRSKADLFRYAALERVVPV